MTEPTTPPSPSKIPYLLTFYIPTTYTTQTLTAIHQTGAGTYPLYDRCAFITRGTGTFRPLPGSTPAIGNVGTVETVEEDRVEVVCFGREAVVKAVERLKEVHPYETVAYFVVRGEEI